MLHAARHDNGLFGGAPASAEADAAPPRPTLPATRHDAPPSARHDNGLFGGTSAPATAGGAAAGEAAAAPALRGLRHDNGLFGGPSRAIPVPAAAGGGGPNGFAVLTAAGGGGSGGFGLFSRASAAATAAHAAPPLHIDLAALAAATNTATASIYAPGSTRAYSSHVRNYLAFCAAICAPSAAGWLPGQPVILSVLVAYCVWYVALKPNKRFPGQPHVATTLEGAVSALKAAARTDGWARSPSNGESYNGSPGFALTSCDMKTVNGVIRALGKVYPTATSMRKLPMRLAFLVRIWDWYKQAPTWARTRDRVWQGLAHQGLLRVGEICGLKAEDVRIIRDARQSVVAVQLLLRESKTADYSNTATRGAQFVTIAARDDVCDAVGPLLAWMQQRGALAPDGALVPDRGSDLLFPAAEGATKAITKAYVATTLREGLVAIGLSAEYVDRYSGRSLRAGGATDMRDSNVPWHVIVMQGRWRSDAWKVYFRESADIISHLRQLKPVALDAIQLLAPGALASADAIGAAQERLPTLPELPAESGQRPAGGSLVLRFQRRL